MAAAAAQPLKDCTNDFAFDEAEDAEPRPARLRRINNAAAPGKVSAAAAADGGEGDEAVPNDPHRLAQRQKQVDYGKNTLGYEFYVKMVPRDKRRCKNGVVWLDPSTPDIDMPVSKRCFDGLIRVWRKSLHKYDEMAAAQGSGATGAGDAKAEEEGKEGKAKRVTVKSEPRESSRNPDAPPSGSVEKDSKQSSEKVESPRPSAGSKRYFKDAFLKNGTAPAAGSTPEVVEPSPKKAAQGSRRKSVAESPMSRPRRVLDPDNILDNILGQGGASHDGVSVGGGTGSGYHLLTDDAGASNASFIGRLDRLGVDPKQQ